MASEKEACADMYGLGVVKDDKIMSQITLFTKDQELKSLFQELEVCSEYSSRCRILLDKIAELIGAEFRGSDLVYKETGRQVDIYKIHKEVGFLPKSSMQYRLDAAGVKTIRNGKTIDLEYKGKIIARPMVNSCVQTIKREFGIDI